MRRGVLACIVACLLAPLPARAAVAVPLLPGLRDRLVVIDPGHGGVDPGAVGHGYRESTINIAVSRIVAEDLRALGVRTWLTHGGPMGGQNAAGAELNPDRRLNLRLRTAEANRLRPDCFLSIHVNHFSGARARGSQVFIDKCADESSQRLAEYLTQHLRAVTGSRRQVSRSINHYLLKHVAVPRATVELGFISNPAEANLLASPTYERRLAHAVAIAVLQFLSDHPQVQHSLGS